MSIPLYTQIKAELGRFVDAAVSESSRERLALLVTGIIGSESLSPAKIASAIYDLGLSAATEESVERRVRRIENDPALTAASCFHRLAWHRLRWSRAEQLVLAIDPTTQDERVVMLTVSVQYRGRALPLAWAVWAANSPLTGARFWERVAALLDLVATLVPARTRIVVVADRAFGTPAFTDLVTAHGWFYVVRVQGQARCRDQRGVEHTIRSLVTRRRDRRKLTGTVFKKRGWRAASVVVHWGAHHATPLCLVTNLGARWEVIALYRRRYAIEGFFRDCKSAGWEWERNQVTDLAHTERLLVGLALASWLVVGAGTQVATAALARPATPRRSRPYLAKYSLFALGLRRLRAWRPAPGSPGPGWRLTDWEAPNWSTQLPARHRRAFVFQARPARFAASSDC